jgi:L-lactate utilization protein LutB
MHVVLVDNGWSERLGLEELWTSLKCIRCGAAAASVCPVKINIHQQIYRGIAHRGHAIDAAQATAPT